MGFESLNPASQRLLVEIASQAYGSGRNEGVKGGAGRVGILTGSDGRAHVVKFNTNLSERLFGSSKTDYMIDSCNRLRAELVKLADEAGLDDEEMAKIRAKLGLGNGTDSPKSLLDRTVVAQVVTMIGKGDARSIVWNLARKKAVMSSGDMSFETVAARQAFGTQSATAEKVVELGKLGLTLDSLKEAVNGLAESKGLSPKGKDVVFSMVAEHAFTALCGKKDAPAARATEVGETLRSIANGTHSVVRRLLDEAEMVEHLKGRVAAAMRAEPVTADALFALFRESFTLIAMHCVVSGVQVDNLQSEEGGLLGRTVTALLKASGKLKELCAEGQGGAYDEVCRRTTMQDDPELARIHSLCCRINVARQKIDDEDMAGKIGLSLEEFRSVFDEVQMPPRHRDRVWEECRERINLHAREIRNAIVQEGIGSLKRTIAKAADRVIAAAREKDGPSLDWGREIDRFGGVFARDAESRRVGIALMKKFHGWFADFVKSTKGRLPVGALEMAMEDGFRFFMFRELSLRDSVTEDLNEMFGKNALTDLARKGLIGRGSAPMTLLSMTPEKRQVLYAAVGALPGQITETNHATLLFCRIVHHLDKVQEELERTGRLDAKSLFTAIFPDFKGKIPEPLTTKQFENAYDSIETTLLAKYRGGSANVYGPNLPQLLKAKALLESGKSLEEVENAMNGLPVEPEKYPLEIHLPLSQFGEDINPGRAVLAADISRPMRAETGEAAYTFRFPNGTVIVSASNKNATKQDNLNRAGQVAEQVVNLCGSEHVEQINIAEAQMCQAGFPGEIGKMLQARGHRTNEHIALTFTLSRDEETGAVRIHYSEPEGCKLHISADVTVHPDGRIERSEVTVVEKELG